MLSIAYEKYPVIGLYGALLTVSGCIKPEAENMEADILVMTLPDSVLISPPSITNTSVTAFVNFSKLDIKAVAPQFTLTEGARIQPASGTPQDFSRPVTYTVTSEDGQWKKQYRVSLLQNVAPDNFMFENWTINPDGNYYIPYELVEAEHQNIWASGNSGFSLIAPEKRPDAYLPNAAPMPRRANMPPTLKPNLPVRWAQS